MSYYSKTNSLLITGNYSVYTLKIICINKIDLFFVTIY